MNLVTFLVNLFFIDCREAQEKGTKFHYAWLFILISLVAWREPKETEFLEGMQKSYLEARYVSLWHAVHKKKIMDNNITVYVYTETIHQYSEDTPHIIS